MTAPAAPDTDVGLRPTAMVRGLALAVGLPLVTYYGLHLVGDRRCSRRLNPFAALISRNVWYVARAGRRPAS